MRLLSCATFALGAAAQVGVKLEADLDPVTAGEVFNLVVTTNGASPETVEFEQLPGIVIQRTPSSHQSSTTIVNGRVSQQIMLTFPATVADTGTIELPPATITVGGKAYKTNPLKVTAVEKVERRGPTLEDGVRVSSFTDKTEVYEGEPVRLTLEVWELDAVSKTGVSEYPTTVGFFAVPQEPVPAGRPVDKQYEGLRYRVAQETQMLYPTRSGPLEIGAFKWRGKVTGYARFNGLQRRVAEVFEHVADPITITVKPLPERPAGFAGSVGSFVVQGGLSSEQVDQGVPVKLAIHIKGHGNPRALSAPDAPFLDWAHVGEPSRLDNAPGDAVNGGVDQYFEYAITPHTAGKHQVPRMHFVYFNPDAGAYETKGVGPFSLTVFSSGESDRPVVFDAAQQPSAAAIDILTTDILPIVTGTHNLKRGGGVPAWFWVAGVVPVCAYAAAAGFVIRRRRLEGDHIYARAYRARSAAHRELRGVLDSDRPEEALHRALIQYIAHTFNAPEAGMTAHDADRVLESDGVNEELRRNVQTILRKCERAVYASQALPEDEMKALVHGAAAVIDQTKHAGRRGVA